MTATLRDLAAEVVRGLSGERVEANAVFNPATQYGGGMTHALTLLWHLAKAGPSASGWRGVSGILSQARVPRVPRAATAAIVGTELRETRGNPHGAPRVEAGREPRPGLSEQAHCRLAKACASIAQIFRRVCFCVRPSGGPTLPEWTRSLTAGGRAAAEAREAVWA
jgi:hypothetical protein